MMRSPDDSTYTIHVSGAVVAYSWSIPAPTGTVAVDEGIHSRASGSGDALSVGRYITTSLIVTSSASVVSAVATLRVYTPLFITDRSITGLADSNVPPAATVESLRRNL